MTRLVYNDYWVLISSQHSLYLTCHHLNWRHCPNDLTAAFLDLCSRLFAVFACQKLTSHALGGLASSGQTLLHMQQRTAGGRKMTSWPPRWTCDFVSKIRLRQSMCNNPTKFHPDPIWNDGALGFSEKRRPNQRRSKWFFYYNFFGPNTNNNKNKKNHTMGGDMGSVPDPTDPSKISIFFSFSRYPWARDLQCNILYREWQICLV